jgi:hypothetical protein
VARATGAGGAWGTGAEYTGAAPASPSVEAFAGGETMEVDFSRVPCKKSRLDASVIGETWTVSSEGVTPPSSLLRTHASIPSPLPSFGLSQSARNSSPVVFTCAGLLLIPRVNSYRLRDKDHAVRAVRHGFCRWGYSLYGKGSISSFPSIRETACRVSRISRACRAIMASSLMLSRPTYRSKGSLFSDLLASSKICCTEANQQ